MHESRSTTFAWMSMFVHSERARVIIYVFPFFEDWLLAMLAMLTRAIKFTATGLRGNRQVYPLRSLV